MMSIFILSFVRATFPPMAAVFLLAATYSPSAYPQIAQGAEREEGAIRLTLPLSNVAYRTEVDPLGQYVAVSSIGGTISILRLDSPYGEPEIFFSPINRDEEPERARPLAISPDGVLLALGAPGSLDTPNSARIYLYKRSDRSRVLFTLDGLPSRPMDLEFKSDSGGRRLLLAAALADGQAPRVWEVTDIAAAASNEDREPEASEPVLLPEPYQGFYGDCPRHECHANTVVSAPAEATPVAWIIGTDSGLTVYDDKLRLIAYGSTKENGAFARVSSVSFSPEGRHFALGRLNPDDGPGKPSEADRVACRIDVHETVALAAGVSAGAVKIGEPSGTLLPYGEAEEDNIAECHLSRVAWSGNYIYAGGQYWHEFPGGECRTFQDLYPGDPSAKPEALAVLKWPRDEGVESAEPEAALCAGTDTVMDVEAFGADGGALILTQEPRLVVYDHEGFPSSFPGYSRAYREFDGTRLDFRDSRVGDFMVSDDGSALLLRSLWPTAYVAVDLLAQDPIDRGYIAAAQSAEDTKSKLMAALQEQRDNGLTLLQRSPALEECRWIESLLETENDDERIRARARLNLRDPELVRDIDFLQDSARSGPEKAHAILATSHRIMLVDCESGADSWHQGKDPADLPAPGVPIQQEAWQVRVTGDRRFVIAAHADGVLRWYRFESGQLAMSLFIHADLRNWVLWTPYGQHDASLQGGERLGGWLQSTPLGGGKWSLQMQPLALYPQDSQAGLATAVLRQTGAEDRTQRNTAPDQDRPKLTLEILGASGSIAPNTVLPGNSFTVRVRLENMGGASDDLARRVRLRMPGMPPDTPITMQPVDQGPHYSTLEAEVHLDKCLQTTGRKIVVHASFVDRSLSNDVDIWTATYGGPEAPDISSCPQPKVWGIFVGISNYAGDQFDLRYAHRDAERMFEFWRDQTDPSFIDQTYGRGHLALLTIPPSPCGSAEDCENDERAEAGGYSYTEDDDQAGISVAQGQGLTAGLLWDFVDENLLDKGKRIGDDDIVIVYLAGHGMSWPDTSLLRWIFIVNECDLCTADDIKDEAAYWKSADLAAIVTDIERRAKPNFLFIIDACRDFQVFKKSRPGIDESRKKSEIQSVLRDTNSVVLLGSAAGGRAFEFPLPHLTDPSKQKAVAEDCEWQQPTYPDEGGGAFTHVLLEALSGGARNEDGVVDFQDGGVAKHLAYNVQQICRKQDLQIVTSHLEPHFRDLKFMP